MEPGTLIHVSWFQIDLQSTYSGEEYFEYFTLENVASYKQALEDIDNLVISTGPYDAVMGFSQGANLAAAILLRQVERDPIEQHNHPGFKCAVFLSGWPPYDRNKLEKGLFEEMGGKDTEGIINIPTAHIYDAQDPRVPYPCAHLRSMCSFQNAATFTHDLGHQVPSSRSKDALTNAVQAIKKTIDQALAAH